MRRWHLRREGKGDRTWEGELKQWEVQLQRLPNGLGLPRAVKQEARMAAAWGWRERWGPEYAWTHAWLFSTAPSVIALVSLS